MSTLYLIEQRTILRKTSDRLLLCRMRTAAERRSHVTQGEILLEIPCADVDYVMAFGNVQFTTQALHELLEHGIELAIFSYSGQLIGQLTPAKARNIFLRMAQFARCQDKQFCLELGKELILNKVEHIKANLKNFRVHNPNVISAQAMKQFDKLSGQIRQTTSADQLLGYEGAASAAYFKLFCSMVKPPWKFTGRNRRPPKDPVNAVLSFGYVVIGSEIQSQLDGIGFDPYLGFYHAPAYGRPSLALDLLEEFRHSVIDRLALRLFNLGIVTESDFYSPAQGGIYLATEGKKKFFAQYEKLAGKYQSDTDTAEVTPGFRRQIQKRIYEISRLISRSSEQLPPIESGAEDFDV